MDPKLAESYETLLLGLGFASSKIASLSRNKDALARTVEMVQTEGLAGRKLQPHQTNLLAALATNGGNLEAKQCSYILRHLLEDQITSPIQLTG
jgi:hypothetical protein